jgi:hypothetical protein
MNTENSKNKGLKQVVVHELKQMTFITVYLAFFFCALATYSALLMQKSEVAYLTYGAALINALVVAKVILIGEAAHVGKSHEAKPLVYSCFYKAFLYTLLVVAFHVIEEIIKGMIHGKDVTSAFRDIHPDEVLARSVIIFCTFIPFFAFRELARVLDPEKLRSLFFASRGTPKP